MYFFGETSSHLNLMEKREIIFSLIVSLRGPYNIKNMTKNHNLANTSLMLLGVKL